MLISMLITAEKLRNCSSAQSTGRWSPVWCWQIMLGNTNNKMLNYAAAPDSRPALLLLSPVARGWAEE